MDELGGFLELAGKEPARFGFVLDFDGTLASIVDDPAEARAVSGAAETLDLLAEKYRVVAIVTGRRAQDVEGRLGASRVQYLGLYGAEELIAGELRQASEAERWRTMASRLARDAQALVTSTGLDGCEVEYKDLAVSVHYRNARDPDVGSALGQWAETAAPRRGFRASMGRMVLEMTPVGLSKAGALERIVRGYSLKAVVAAGDDTADVEALIRARELLGKSALTVGVLSAESPDSLREHSRAVVGSPDELVDLLRRFDLVDGPTRPRCSQ